MTRKHLKFHIKADDYFGTLATVLDLAKQSMKKGKNTREGLPEHLKLLEKLKGDLVFLHQHYRIVKK